MAQQPNVGSQKYAQFNVDITANLAAALGLVKDWATALITLQTAALGAIGTLAISGPLQSLTPIQKGLIILTAVAFVASDIFGGLVLYMLPGCAQRAPNQNFQGPADLYAIANVGNWTLGDHAKFFWWCFEAGVVLFGVFLVVRLLNLF